LALTLASLLTVSAWTGTNIGGWMVLEPWITPSLFYRFLGKEEGQVAMDSYTLCDVLGPEEGNKLMRAHWDSWYTEDHIKDLSTRGIEMVRLPIGDWTLDPYGPYVGCMDGAEDAIQWMFDTCAKYNISIWLDVHAVKGSQNGFDNSGMTNKVEWINSTHFSHWDNAQANWMGQWNISTGVYDHINFDHLAWSVDVCEKLLKRWGSHSAMKAFEPVNEPWWNSNFDVLKAFYRRVRPMVQKLSPQSYFVFHDGFTYSPDMWNDLFRDDDIDKVVMDHHYYQAWNGDMFTTWQFCDDYERNSAAAEDFKYEVWFGEWALATDVCAHWLGGFNDGNTNIQFKCNPVECPQSYLPEPFNVDFDRSADVLGPHGTGNQDDVAIHNGMCWDDSLFFNQTEVQTIAKCALDSMKRHNVSPFLWTAHNEIEAKWDYIRAWDMGWLNQTALADGQMLTYPAPAKTAEPEQIEFLQ